MNLIDCAIDRDKMLRGRFDDLAGTATTPERQEIFTLLAAEAESHLRHLHQLRDELRRHRGALSVEIDTCLPLALAPQELEESDGFLAVDRLVAANVARYEACVTRAENPRLRALLERLLAAEHQHRQRIAQIYDFVEGPKTYLAWGEFANLRDF